MIIPIKCFFLTYVVFIVEARRPRAARPQERRATPGLLPTAEDLVGALVPSRWKWPLYAEQRPPTLGEWRKGHKPGEWNWKGDRRALEPKENNRWSPYFGKKITGLEKKKPQKFLGPKFKKQKRPPLKVRLAPVTDLRPNSIDRIDILRPQPHPVVPRISHPIEKKKKIVSNAVKKVKSKQTEKPRLRKHDERPATAQTTALTTPESSPIEVDGIKIYMFRGDEGIGGLKPPNVSKFQQNKVLSEDVRNNRIKWSKAEVKPQKELKQKTYVKALNTVPPSRSSSPRARSDFVPPFPTRHTTSAPNQANQPIVIIAQSNVAQN